MLTPDELAHYKRYYSNIIYSDNHMKEAQICGCCGATATNAKYSVGDYKYFNSQYGLKMFETVDPPSVESVMNNGGHWSAFDRCEYKITSVTLADIGWSYHIVTQLAEPEDEDEDDNW